MLRNASRFTGRRHALAAGVLSTFAVPAAFGAPGDPLGPPIDVNTTQGAFTFDPAIARSGKTGDFVVVWEETASSSSPYQIRGRRFKADGTPVGNDFQVNVSTLADHSTPAVAMDDDGDFVVSWAVPAAHASTVYARRYAADGTAGLPLLVTLATGWVGSPEVAMDPDGDFVVGWTQSNYLTGFAGLPMSCYYDQLCVIASAENSSLHLRRYTARGLPLGVESVVDSAQWAAVHISKVGTIKLPLGRPPYLELTYNSSVAMAADGSITVAWSRPDKAAAGVYDTYVRRYSGRNVPSAPQLVSSGDYPALNPRIAADHAGGFVLTYGRPIASAQGIFQRRFGADGSAQGGEVRVDDGSYPQARNPQVSMDAAGDFVVVWEPGAYDTDGSYAALGQRYAASGSPLGGNFRLNLPGQVSWMPSVASDAAGNFAAAWFLCCNADIQVRLFAGP